MGSGSHTAQVAERFYQGEVVREGYSIPCREKIIARYEIGNYVILESKSGFQIVKGVQIIGSFAEGRVLEEENRALFKSDKGMLFEVTPEWHRHIFSREKANLHGYVCADGYLACGKTRGGRRSYYFLRAEEPERVLRTLFSRNVKEVYGIEAHDACGKEMAYDLSKYGPFGHYVWRVPFEYLDKEGAACWHVVTLTAMVRPISMRGPMGELMLELMQAQPTNEDWKK